MMAHDIYETKICGRCNYPALRDAMVETVEGHYHGRCFIRSYGLDALLALPAEELNKLTISDVGVPVIRQIMARDTSKPVAS